MIFFSFILAQYIPAPQQRARKMCHFNEFIPRNVVWIFRAAGDGAGIYAEKTPPFDGVCGGLERLFLGNLNHLSIHLHSVKSV
jgi:hypothetical protein